MVSPLKDNLFLSLPVFLIFLPFFPYLHMYVYILQEGKDFLHWCITDFFLLVKECDCPVWKTLTAFLVGRISLLLDSIEYFLRRK